GDWSGTAHSRSPAAINSRYQRFFIPAHPLHLPLVADHEIQLQHGFGYEDTGGSQGDPQGRIQADGEPCRRQNAPLEDLAGHGLGPVPDSHIPLVFLFDVVLPGHLRVLRLVAEVQQSGPRHGQQAGAYAAEHPAQGIGHPAVQQQGQDQQDDAHGQKSL
ncbi:Flavodoxin, partial [Dysosmobacter welbionis]